VDVIDRMAVVTPNPLCVAANLEDLEGGWCLVGNHLDVPDNGFFTPKCPILMVKMLINHWHGNILFSKACIGFN
jgi:hypothetical protein